MELLPLMYLKIDFFFFTFSLNGEICKCFDVYVRPSLRQLHLIFHKFSTELFPLIYIKGVSFGNIFRVNGWNFINVLYVLWCMQYRGTYGPQLILYFIILFTQINL